MNKARTAGRRRNRGFEGSHQALIETAVRIISERGADSLSISALAREVGLNRTTVYYHFPNREAMLRAVRDWSTEQLARGMDVDTPKAARLEHMVGFVLDNPQLVKLWIDDFLSPGDIRERYPRWDIMVAAIGALFGAQEANERDAEVYAVILLTGAVVAPRVFQQSVAQGLTTEEIRARFVAEQRRILKRDGLS